MEQFLQESKDNLVKLHKFTLIHLVIGNESCDLDSAVSALVLAYILYKSKYSNSKDSLVLPILNVKRRQLKLRTDITFWIQEAAKLDLKLLICKDEVDWDQIKNGKQRVVISLVDHNLDKEFESFGTVVQIVDHHQQVPRDISSEETTSVSQDENYDQLDKEVVPGVGSCCSLVTKRYVNFLKAATPLPQDNQNRDSDVQIALLLYGPVILDTICFSESSKRFTVIDEEAAEQLERFMGSDSVTRQEVYQQLINAKNRPASSLEEYFEKDLKLATASILPPTPQTPSASPSSSSSLPSTSSLPSLPSITVTIAVPSISGQLVRDLFTSTSTTTTTTSTAATSTSTTTAAATTSTSSTATTAAQKSDSSQAITCSSEIIYVTSSLLNQLEEYRTTVDTNCLAVVILGIRNSDPNKIERDLALYSPHTTLLKMMSAKLNSPSSQLQLTLTSVKVKSTSDSSVPEIPSPHPTTPNTSPHLHLYSQSNITASRKAILPLIYEVLADPNSKAHLLQASQDDSRQRGFTCDERVDGQVKKMEEEGEGEKGEKVAGGSKNLHAKKKEKREEEVDYSECTYTSPSEETVPQVTSSPHSASESEAGGVAASDSSDQGPRDSPLNWSGKSHSPYATHLDASKISTAHVDPEFVLSYTPETVDLPESPKFPLSPVHIRPGSSSPASVTQGDNNNYNNPGMQVVVSPAPGTFSSSKVEVVTCPRYPKDDHSSHTDHLHQSSSSSSSSSTSSSLPPPPPTSASSQYYGLDSLDEVVTCANNTPATNRTQSTSSGSSSNSFNNNSRCTTLSGEKIHTSQSSKSHLHTHQCEKDSPPTRQQPPQGTTDFTSSQQESPGENFQGPVALPAPTDQGSLRNYFISTREGDSNSALLANNQPTSINYYESYFDDSYVGDFSGEVELNLNNQLTHSNSGQHCIVDPSTLLWCSDPDLNPSLLEFTYDSFGPESIVFNNSTASSSSSNSNFTGSNNFKSSLSNTSGSGSGSSATRSNFGDCGSRIGAATADDDSPPVDGLKVTPHSLSQGSSRYTQGFSTLTNNSFLPTSSNTTTSTSSSCTSATANSSGKFNPLPGAADAVFSIPGETEATTTTADDDNLLMSLSITEPQLREKLNNCFDNKKISLGYDIALHTEEEKDHPQLQSQSQDEYTTTANDRQDKLQFNIQGKDISKDQMTVVSVTVLDDKEPSSPVSNESHSTVDSLDCKSKPLTSIVTTASHANDHPSSNDDTHNDDREETKNTSSMSSGISTASSPLNDADGDASAGGVKVINNRQEHLMNMLNKASDVTINKSSSSPVPPTTIESNEEAKIDQTAVESSDHTSFTSTSEASSSSSHSSPPPSLPCSDSSGSSLSRTSSALGTFSRSSTLSRSQRRKISPKMNLQEFLNSGPDDVNLQSQSEEQKQQSHQNAAMSQPAMLEINCDQLKSAQLLDDELRMNPDGAPDSINGSSGHNSYYSYLGGSGPYSRTGTWKKKITISKDLLDTDDILTINDGRSSGHNCNAVAAQNGSQGKSCNKNYHEEHTQSHVEDSSRWMRSYPIEGECKPIDLRVIEPYKKVISHAGYYHQFNSVQLTRNNLHTATGPAIITFSACYLPDRSRRDYHYVMDHLFMYVLTTLHELVADDYILIYFHNPSGAGSTSGNNMPTFGWLKRCYHMIDRKLRKNLKSLYLVHPTFWLKTLVIMTKPLLSSKFSRKLRFVSTLKDLNELVPMEPALIPDSVKQQDEYFEARITN